MKRNELIDAIAASSKLSKADAGKLLKRITDEALVKLLFGMSYKKTVDALANGAKLTKADAGRVLDVTLELIRKKLKVVFGGKGQRKLKTVFGGKGQITK